MSVRIAVPSKGRLRESCLDLLSHAGYRVGGFAGSAATATSGIEFIEMRPRDAAAWFVEYASMPQQSVRRISDVPEDYRAPYFSIIIVHGQGRRP